MKKVWIDCRSWHDRESAHESLKKDMREECYELMDAIDENNDEHIIEECGDVLMNIMFHPLIGEEQGRYDDRDVTTEVVRKLIYRHPHVFGTVKVSSSEEAEAGRVKTRAAAAGSLS